MFDTHTHLNDPAFEEDLKGVINKAKEAGVNKFLVAGTNIDTSKKAKRLADKWIEIYAAVGIHPTENLEAFNLDTDLQKIEKLALSTDKVVAIGEIGLDYYRYISAPSLQQKFFSAQINLAKKVGLSLIIHNRVAGEDVIKLLGESWSNSLKGKVVFHCVEPEENLLKFALEKEIYLGIDADITYNEEKQKFLKNIPLERIVLETDSPYLLPRSLKEAGVKRNEPKNVTVVRDKIADILEEDSNTVEKVTTKNAKMLFDT